MKKVKRFLGVILSISLIMSMGTVVLANDSKENETSSIQKVNDTYYDIFVNCNSATYDIIENDYDAYSYLLQNKEFVLSVEPLKVSLEAYNILKEKEKEILDEFVNKINNLLEVGAIAVEDNLLFVMPMVSEEQENVMPYTQIIDMMSEARSHAKELKKVYNNAPFGTRHIVAGTYFTERVKSGGVWDYKKYLGTTTVYFEKELAANMTGETIGNFHYGYVGSAVFGPTTLKSAAGLVQIISGTSDIKFWNSYFDDPKDQKDIEWGIRKYNQDH